MKTPKNHETLERVLLRIVFIKAVLKNGKTDRAIVLLSELAGNVSETLKRCEHGGHNFEDVPTSQMLGLKQCVKCGKTVVK